MLVDCDLLSLETLVRDQIGESSAKLWTQAHVFRAINAEFGFLVREVNRADGNYFDTTATTTLTSATVTLPRMCMQVRFFEVYRDGRWWPVRAINSSEKYKYNQSDTSTAYAKAIRFEGNTLILEPGYANVTKLKIGYSKAPPKLIYGTAAAGAATTITFPSTAGPYDDIYNGVEIETLAGTGLGQTNTVTDYVGSTKVATVSTWTTNPDSTTTFSSLLPDPLNKYPDLVALGAALRLVSLRRDSELYELIAASYNRDFTGFQNDLEPRQTDQVRYGEYVPREDD